MKWVTAVIKGSEVSIAFDENSIHIYNAFPIKDDLKLRGYRWNPNDKSWQINPADVDSEMNILKNNFKQEKKATAARQETDLAKFPGSCSVLELRNRIEETIRAGVGGNIWVRGIIASQIKNYQWYSYFDLKDEDEKLDIYFNMEVKTNDLWNIIGKMKTAGIAESLEKDLPIFCLVEVHLSTRNEVDIRLRMLDILPEYTSTKLRNQREITLDKLQAEGLLEKQKRLSLPGLVFRLGLITSGQGTSIRDIMAGLSPFEKKYDFYFVDTRMEGVNALESLIQAVDYLENYQAFRLDAIIIARGGGSEQSLAVFNDYRLCRRICNCGIPILTAIGHEKDISAAEICSFLTPAPATPSGIGKYLHDRFIELQGRLADSVQDLVDRFANIHNREIEKIKAFVKNIPLHIKSFFQLRKNGFFALARRFAESVSYTVRDAQKRLEQSALQALLPAAARQKREERQIAKTILKIDFQKRLRLHELLLQEVRRLAREALRRAKRSELEKEKTLQQAVDLVKASDPANILKKGFTLTLAANDRIIKTLQEFDKSPDTRLRFHDGMVKIKKEEET